MSQRITANKKEWNEAVKAGKVTSTSQSIKKLKLMLDNHLNELKAAYQDTHEIANRFGVEASFNRKPLGFYIKKDRKIRKIKSLLRKKEARSKKGYL
jgi:hypothetical protein